MKEISPILGGRPSRGKIRVKIIDQTLLPWRLRYLNISRYQDLVRAIRDMKIRGAPALGAAGAFAVALAAFRIKAKSYAAFYKKILPAARAIKAARPTAVNLSWGVDQLLNQLPALRTLPLARIKEKLFDFAGELVAEDVSNNKKIGEYGSRLIKRGATILTHCNAGALATGGYGTALGVIRTAHRRGKKIRVLADETRPRLQGACLTTWELKQEKIPVTLITDSMAGYFMKKGAVDLIIVGADRIAKNGDTANKIGTYSLAVLAREHGIPFYIAAPESTIDRRLAAGREIPIEERSEEEVLVINGRSIAPAGVPAANPAFDVTPARYITAIITEKGIYQFPYKF